MDQMAPPLPSVPTATSLPVHIVPNSAESTRFMSVYCLYVIKLLTYESVLGDEFVVPKAADMDSHSNIEEVIPKTFKPNLTEP